MMKTLPLFAALVGLTAAVPVAAQTTKTIPVKEDSWISGLSSTTNHGADTSLGICPVARYQIYLKFDLSGVTGTIDSAELRLGRFSGTRPEEISLYRINGDSWTEATLDGPSRPEPTDPDPVDALGVGAVATGYDSWTSVDLTGAVQAELDGDGTISFMLREDPGGGIDVRYYYSREGATGPEVAPQLVLTMSETEQIDPNWLITDIGAGTKPSLDVFNESYYIMGMTEMIGGGVWFASSETPEGPWTPTRVKSGYFYGPGDIRVAQNGTAHIAWHDHVAQNPGYVAVSPGGATTTASLNSFPQSHDGWDNSLAFDSSGNLFMASVDPSTFGATTSLEFWSFDGSDWAGEKVPGSGSFMYGYNTSIAFAMDDTTHILFCQGTSWTDPGELMHAVRTPQGWDVSPVTSGGIHRFPSLALDHWDRPQAAWLSINPATPTMAEVKYAVFNNNAWEIETVDTLKDVELSFTGARKSVSLALDSNWRPHLAYSDRSVVRYAVKPFADWEYTTVASNSEHRYKGLAVLRLDSTDDPSLVFWETETGSPGMVRLAVTRSATATPTPTAAPVDTPTPTPSPTFTPVPTPTPDADLNNDGVVDYRDLLLLHNAWHESQK